MSFLQNLLGGNDSKSSGSRTTKVRLFRTLTLKIRICKNGVQKPQFSIMIDRRNETSLKIKERILK